MPEDATESIPTQQQEKPHGKKVQASKITRDLDGTKIHIKLYSPFKTYFDDDAKSISAENDTGPFDILPKHHNFITLLSSCEIMIVKLDGKELRVQISKGVMHVRNNKITVFLDV